MWIELCFLAGLTIAQVIGEPNSQWEQYYGEEFNCFQDTHGTYNNLLQDDFGVTVSTGSWWCCGITANGERACAPADEWSMPKTGKFALCSTRLDNNSNTDEIGQTSLKGKRDLCCDNQFFNDCDVCVAFVVWEFDDFEQMSTSQKTTLDDSWRSNFEDQDLVDWDSYDNNVYPGGYAHARLRQGNDPPVCVYVPESANKVVEIRVEPDEEGNRLCVSDLHDDSKDRNDPGQITTCDDSSLKTCFIDAEDTQSNNNVPGVAFYIECDTTCEEQTDVYLWYRVRTSTGTWADNGDNGASNNIEMWCDTVNGEYPEYDLYPSDLAPTNTQLNLEQDNGVAVFSFLVSVVALLFVF